MTNETRNREITSSNSIYIGEDVLKKIITVETPHLLIPRINLFGTQTATEYSSNKRRLVESALTKQGINFLTEHPILTCAVTKPEETALYIIDGHHRARYSGRFRIFNIPCLVITLSELAQALIQDQQDVSENILTEENLLSKLITDSAEAIISFSKLREDKYPRVIRGISTLQELITKFQSFTSNLTNRETIY